MGRKHLLLSNPAISSRIYTEMSKEKYTTTYSAAWKVYLYTFINERQGGRGGGVVCKSNVSGICLTPLGSSELEVV